MAPSIRLFVTAPLHAGARIEATRPQTHYLRTVMRREPGDPVTLFNGADGEWLAHIGMLRRDSATLLVDRPLRPQAAEPDLWLLFAPLKRDATDLLVQKATELGVAALKPVLTERANTARLNLRPPRRDCHRGRRTVRAPHDPRHRPAAPARRGARGLAGRAPAGRRGRTRRRSAGPSIRHPAALLVGPEGGFAPAELDALRRHPFVQPATLGPRILRAETAAIVGLALLLARSGG